MKVHWAILRHPFYPVHTVNIIVMACCLHHSLIGREMAIDPVKEHYDMSRLRQKRRDEDHIGTLESSDEKRLKHD